jgi:hypothetical protein
MCVKHIDAAVTFDRVTLQSHSSLELGPIILNISRWLGQFYLANEANNVKSRESWDGNSLGTMISHILL